MHGEMCRFPRAACRQERPPLGWGGDRDIPFLARSHPRLGCRIVRPDRSQSCIRRRSDSPKPEYGGQSQRLVDRGIGSAGEQAGSDSSRSGTWVDGRGGSECSGERCPQACVSPKPSWFREDPLRPPSVVTARVVFFSLRPLRVGGCLRHRRGARISARCSRFGSGGRSGVLLARAHRGSLADGRGCRCRTRCRNRPVDAPVVGRTHGRTR